MSANFVSRTSRVAIAERVAEYRRLSHGWDELTPAGDYHPPFGKVEGSSRSRQVALAGLITPKT
jgi:hypothetical protein